LKSLNIVLISPILPWKKEKLSKVTLVRGDWILANTTFESGL
jgi:hypothetical protein